MRLSSRHCPPLLLVTFLDRHHSLQGEANRSKFDTHTSIVLAITTSYDTLDARHASCHLRHIHEKLPQCFSRDRDRTPLLEVHTKSSSLFGPGNCLRQCSLDEDHRHIPLVLSGPSE